MKVIEHLTKLAHEAYKQPCESPAHEVLYHDSSQLLPLGILGFRQSCYVLPTKSEHTITINVPYYFTHEKEKYGWGFMQAIVTPRVFLKDLATTGLNIKIQWANITNPNQTGQSNTVCKKYWKLISDTLLEYLLKEMPDART
jgi:hypothetical protein